MGIGHALVDVERHHAIEPPLNLGVYVVAIEVCARAATPPVIRGRLAAELAVVEASAPLSPPILGSGALGRDLVLGDRRPARGAEAWGRVQCGVGQFVAARECAGLWARTPIGRAGFAKRAVPG